MLQSMTAFVHVQKQIETGNLCWEVRSVNHRYLDVSFRLPEPFRFIEMSLRALLKGRISRGKLEFQLKYQPINCNQSLMTNQGIIEALIDLNKQLQDDYQLVNDLSTSKILSWPGVIEMKGPDVEQIGQQAISVFHEVLERLQQHRLNEGKALKEHINARLHDLKFEVNRAHGLIKQQEKELKDKLFTRLSQLELKVTEARVEQEIALILTRMDMTEELDRLRTHINEVNRTLNQDRVAGRRLDFLMQELNREANTLSSKSDAAELTQSAVEMKVLIEQMREQIQNIE